MTSKPEESCHSQSHVLVLLSDEDKKVLDACEKWLQQAEALVIEADAKIEGIMHHDTGNLLAEEWVTFVHKYSMQIKDIEQVSHAFLEVSLMLYFLGYVCYKTFNSARHNVT